MCQFNSEIFIVRSVSVVGPSSVTHDLRGRYHTISSYDMLLQYSSLPLKLAVTEDGQTAKTGLTIKIYLWNWHIIYPTSHHDEFPLYRRKDS